MAGKTRGRQNHWEHTIQPNLDNIRKWKEEGIQNRDICKMLEVSEEAFYKHLREQSDFREVIKEAKGVRFERMQEVVEKAQVNIEILVDDCDYHAIQYVLNNYGGAMTEYQRQSIALKKEENQIKREQNEMLAPLISDDLINELIKDIEDDK